MIFAAPQRRAVKIWVDPQLPTYTELSSLLQIQGASISSDHADPSTSIVVLHPSSTTVFDDYCHPTWLSMSGVFRHIKRKRAGGAENWKRKVIVTEKWPGACLAAGRYLGEEDDWGGCRKGGPVKRVVPAMTLSTDPPPAILVEPAPPAPVSPRPAPEPLQPAASAATIPIAIPPSGPRKIAGLPARPSSRLLEATPPTASAPSAPRAAQVPTEAARQPDRTALKAGFPSATAQPAQAPTQGAHQPTADAPAQPPSAPTAAEHDATTTASKTKGLSIIRGADFTTIVAATSKWQTAQDPPKILRGLRFYLDEGRNGRRTTMKNIVKALGKIVAEPHLATHLLLSQVTAVKSQERSDLIKSATAAGAWCVSYEWLESSWDAGRRLDEADYVYEGGTPHGVELEEGEVYQRPRAVKQLPAVKHVPTSKQLPSQYALPRDLPFSPKRLDEILRHAHPISLMPGKKPSDVWKHLFENYPERMSKYSWMAIYHSWLDRTGPFTSAAGDKSYTRFILGLQSFLPEIRAGRSVKDVAESLASRYPELLLSAAEWEVHLGNWLRTLPPDTPDHATPTMIREKPGQEKRAAR